jgi:hypothetical protein
VRGLGIGTTSAFSNSNPHAKSLKPELKNNIRVLQEIKIKQKKIKIIKIKKYKMNKMN